MRESGTVVVACCIAAGGAQADPDELWDALRLGQLVEVMAEEGQLYGADLADQIFEERGGPSWRAAVADLYDPDRMVAGIRPDFIEALEGTDTEPLLTFFESDLGQRIVEHELDARRAFLEPDVEAAAAELAETLPTEDPSRYRLLQDFIETNDLVETNVASSLTFSYAFNLGLVDADLEGMTRADALEDAWAQEDVARDDTRRWVYAQLSLAFAPLSDEELQKYVDLSATDEGEALNAALFQAFEGTFTEIARGLGREVAEAMAGRDI